MVNDDDKEILGFTPIYRPRKASIVTQAFILCSSCGVAISTTGGPRHGSLCVDCTIGIISTEVRHGQ